MICTRNWVGDIGFQSESVQTSRPTEHNSPLPTMKFQRVHLVAAIICVVAASLVEALPAKKCACASVDVQIQREVGQKENSLGLLKTPDCLPYLGDQKSINDGRIYAHVSVNGKSGWLITPSIYIKECHVAYDCMCALHDVPLKSSWSRSSVILARVKSGECVSILEIVNSADIWIKITYGDKEGWIQKKYMSFHKRCPASIVPPLPNINLPGCPTIISRAEWGARPSKTPLTLLSRTPYYAFVHHGATAPCHTRHECIRMVQSYQNFHMDGHGWNDIAYSFLVGEDGNVYEGRGWDNVGSHTYRYNQIGLGFCVVGNFMKRVPDPVAQDALKKLIACGVANGKLTPTYTMLGHRDVGASGGATSCPGDKFYPVIQQWPHYNATVIPSKPNDAA